MPSHFSSLGFPVQSVDDFRKLAKRAIVEAAQTVQVPGVGWYRQWSLGGGAELWVQANLKKEILGMHPHFNGDARMPVRLVKRVLHARNTILDGAFYGWANPLWGRYE